MNRFKLFNQIFWGLLLVSFSLRINNFDLLPDFVGYFLISLGCRGLATVSRHFATAKVLSWFLLVFSFSDFVPPKDLPPYFGLFLFALNCTMIWFLLGGIMELATAESRPDICERASNRRIAFVILGTLLNIFILVANKSDLAPIIILGVIFLFVLQIFILHLIHRVKHELGGQHESLNTQP